MTPPTRARALYPPRIRCVWALPGAARARGQGRLFKGYLATRPSCSNCGLDFDFADSGDGPAVFIIMIVGFIVVGLALAVEMSIRPPIWVHMMLWLPLTLILGLGMLRPLKGLMIAQQYRHSAKEGRVDE